MHGARFRDEKLCSCAGWRFNCSGAVITANTVSGDSDSDDDEEMEPVPAIPVHLAHIIS